MEDESNEWTNAVDRGGFKHVTNMTFIGAEMEFRRHLTTAEQKHTINFSEEEYHREWRRAIVLVHGNSRLDDRSSIHTFGFAELREVAQPLDSKCLAGEIQERVEEIRPEVKRHSKTATIQGFFKCFQQGGNYRHWRLAVPSRNISSG